MLPWMNVLEQESNITCGMTPVYATLTGGGVFNMAAAGSHALHLSAYQLLMKSVVARDTVDLPMANVTERMEEKLEPEEPSDTSDLSDPNDSDGDKKPKAKVTSKKRKADSDSDEANLDSNQEKMTGKAVTQPTQETKSECR